MYNVFSDFVHKSVTNDKRVFFIELDWSFASLFLQLVYNLTNIFRYVSFKIFALARVEQVKG